MKGTEGSRKSRSRKTPKQESRPTTVENAENSRGFVRPNHDPEIELNTNVAGMVVTEDIHELGVPLGHTFSLSLQFTEQTPVCRPFPPRPKRGSTE